MKVAIFHANAGQGHFKVAQVVEKTFLKRGLSTADLILEDALDSTPAFFRKAYPAIYYHSVKSTPALWGWSYEQLDRAGVYRWVRPIRSFVNGIMGGGLVRKMEEWNPDLVICTHFLSAQLFANAKTTKGLKYKLLALITDFLPHSFWINEGTDFFWVMGVDGKNELIHRGIPSEKIVAGGIPVDERFKPTGQTNELRKKWGFESDRFTLLITSGGFGLGHQEILLKSLEPFKDKVQCFVVCGFNKKLPAKLESLKFSFPVKIFGFVDFMPDLMEASDLIIAKPGGSTTSEAMCKQVPMVVIDPIPGQETRNARLLKEHHAAFFMEHPEQIQAILETIFKYPEMMKSKRTAIEKLSKPNAADDLVTFTLKNLE